MPDSFSNARAYFDVTFPSSGDSFSIQGMRNALAGLGFMDAIPLQPRAHNPVDRRIMVRGQDAAGYYNPVYFGNADQRIPFASGDTPIMSAPVSNPRIDIVYLTPSGDIKVQTGTEAASPTLPSLSPSGDSRFPICAVFHKVGEGAIRNYEDKDSNSGDGYIYKDLRAWMRSPNAGGTTLTNTTPSGVTGDGQAAVGVSTTAARADHTHGGVHVARKAGSGDGLGNTYSNMQGDVEFAGGASQNGRRLTITNPTTGSNRNISVTRPSATTVKITYDEIVMSDGRGGSMMFYNGSVTLDVTASGAGGLIAGSTEAASTWYAIILLGNSNTGAISGVLVPVPASTVPKFNIPATYNMSALVSGVFNDGSSNFTDFIHVGRKYNYTVWQTLASGNVGTSPWVAIDMSPFVPFFLSNYPYGIYDGASTGTVAMTNDSSVATAGTAAPNKYHSNGEGMNHWALDILTANTLYWLSSAAGHIVRIHGFDVNKIY